MVNKEMLDNIAEFALTKNSTFYQDYYIDKLLSDALINICPDEWMNNEATILNIHAYFEYLKNKLVGDDEVNFLPNPCQYLESFKNENEEYKKLKDDYRSFEYAIKAIARGEVDDPVLYAQVMIKWVNA